MPLFLLGLDGTVRRVNAAAGALLGSGPGYATGKLFTAFVDLPSRAAVQTQLAAAATHRRHPAAALPRCSRGRGQSTARSPCARCSSRGDADQLIVAAGPRRAGSRPGRPGAAGSTEQAGDQDVAAVQALTRRLDLVIAATRILLENVTYSEQVAVQQYARLLSRELGAWVIIDVDRGHGLRRQMVTGPGTQRAEESWPGPRPRWTRSPARCRCRCMSRAAGCWSRTPRMPARSGKGPDGVPLLMVLGATSLLCVPLSDGERAYGVLTLARQAGQGPFVMSDVGLVEELGEQLALAIRIDRLFRHRSEVADALQASLLPRQVRQIPGTEIAAAHVAATSDAEVGGDFYDVYPARQGWGIAVGDVCGKGEDAAAVTAAARHSIRVFAHMNAAPEAVLRGTNEIMLAEEFGGRFVTATVAYLEWREHALHVSVGSAGHPAVLLISPDGRVRTLQGGGFPLGIFPDAQPAVQQLIIGTR